MFSKPGRNLKPGFHAGHKDKHKLTGIVICPGTRINRISIVIVSAKNRHKNKDKQ